MTAANTGKKPAKNTKKTAKPDVNKPGKSAPSSTSKPVVVTNRPILKDPMVVDEEVNKEGTTKEDLSHTTGPKLQPLKETSQSESDAEGKTDEDKQAESQSDTKPETKEKPASSQTKSDDDDKGDSSSNSEPEPQPDPETEPSDTGSRQKAETQTAEQTRKQTEHDAAVQKLIDSRKYELPINAVEKRKTKRFVALGILLSVLLILAWGDIAADAGLIEIDGLKPVTHFFSN